MPRYSRSPDRNSDRRSYPKRRDSRDRSNKDYSRRRDLRSPTPEHIRRAYIPSSESPPRKRRPSRHSPRDYNPPRSRSRSPPPKRRHYSEDKHRSNHRSRSRSPPPRRHHHSHHRHNNSIPSSRRRSPPPPPPPRSKAPLPSQSDAFNTKDLTKPTSASSPAPPIPKQTANYTPSGLLAAETNTVANTSIVLKYNEPPESRLPPKTSPWRLYVFKGEDIIETLNMWERTCWLFGREKMVVDHVTEHPSCSKQHAVVQFRYTETKDGGGGGEFGEKKKGGRVKPYVIDLESANGTWLNGERMEARRYVEIRSGDVIRFGESTREYVVLLPPREKEGA